MGDDPVLITGGAGFVGRRMCRGTWERGAPFRVFDSNPERLGFAETMKGDVCRGDITTYEQVSEAVKGTRAVIHLITAHEHMPKEAHERITLGGIRNVIRACVEHGVSRFLFISSIKAGRDYPGIYGTTKRRAEALLTGSGLHFTIFRPALLYGPGEARLRRIGEIIRRWHFVPVIGDGSYVVYPIFVDDLVAAMLGAVDRTHTYGKTYDMAGPEALSYDQILDCLMGRLGVRAVKVHVPLAVCGLIARVTQTVSRHPIIFVDQVLAQKAATTCDIGPARRDLDFDPIDFRSGLARYYPETEGPA